MTQTPPLVGTRSTRQKRALAELLAHEQIFRSAQEFHTELLARGQKVGLTTVYSQLKSLAEAGAIDVVHTEDGEALYRQCATGALHHHLLCAACKRVAEIDAEQIDLWLRSVAARIGFTDIRHTLEVTGICGQCHAP